MTGRFAFHGQDSELRERIADAIKKLDETLVVQEAQLMSAQVHVASLRGQRDMLMALLDPEPDPPAGKADAPPPGRPKKKPKAKKRPAVKKKAKAKPTAAAARKPLSAQLEAVREVFQRNAGEWLSTAQVHELADGGVTSPQVAATILRNEWEELGLERKGQRNLLRYRMPAVG